MLSGPCLGAEGELSFLNAYHRARTEAPALSLARYRVDGAAAEEDIAKGRVLPKVTLFGQYSENSIKYENRSFLYQDQDYPGERYGVQVTQALLNVSAGLEAKRLKLLHQQSREELEVAETDLIVDLLEAYLNVLLADSELAQYSAEQRSLESELADATALFDRNLLPLTQLLEIQTRAEAVGADVIMARGNASVAREELRQFVGEGAVEPESIADTISLVNRFASADAAATAAVAHSPVIAAAETSVSAARRGIDRERGSWVPNIDVSYSYQHADVGFDNVRSPPRDTSILTIGFNYPLFEGGAKSARIRAAWAEFRSAETKLRAEIREVETRARSAWLSLDAVSEKFVASKRGVQSAETNVDAARKAVKAGISKPTDVLTALAQNTKAQRELALAKFQYVMGWLELEMATGANPISIAPTLSSALHGD